MPAFAVVLLLVMACAPSSPPADGPAPQNAEAARDSVIRARVGEEFTVTLRANATTGYSWALADSLDPALLAHVRNDYVPDPAPQGMVGSGGHERWTFRALAAGETSIFLRYARAWEHRSAAAATAAFRVVIRP